MVVCTNWKLHKVGVPAEAPGIVQYYSENVYWETDSTIAIDVEAQNAHSGGYWHTEAGGG